MCELRHSFCTMNYHVYFECCYWRAIPGSGIIVAQVATHFSSDFKFVKFFKNLAYFDIFDMTENQNDTFRLYRFRIYID